MAHTSRHMYNRNVYYFQHGRLNIENPKFIYNEFVKQAHNV